MSRDKLGPRHRRGTIESPTHPIMLGSPQVTWLERSAFLRRVQVSVSTSRLPRDSGLPMSLLGVMPFAEFVLLVSFLSASHGFVHNSRASSSTLSKSDSAHSRVSLLGDEKYFVQPVDHFNYITDHLWDQRFFIKG